MTKSGVVLERRIIGKGTLIVKEGEVGNCAYLIQSGKVQVYSTHEGRTVEFARLEAGEIFGEMSLIFDEARTASVKAIEETTLIIIDRQMFEKKLDKTDPTIKAIVKMLTARLVSANKVVVQKKGDLEELVSTARFIYENTLTSLPQNRQRTFQNAILPKLDEFLDSVRAFEEKYDTERNAPHNNG